MTVLSIFSSLKVDRNLYANVFGESVLNDAVAIVLYQCNPFPMLRAQVRVKARARFCQIEDQRYFELGLRFQFEFVLDS